MSELPKLNEKISKETNCEEPLSAKIEIRDFSSYNNHTMGEVLTLIDSSIPESKQQKALKSLIKQSFWRNYDIVWRWMNTVSRIEKDLKTGQGQTYPPFPFDNTISID